MNDALHIAGLAVMGALIALVLRRADKGIAAAAVMAAGAMVLLLSLQHMGAAIHTLRQLSAQALLADDSIRDLAGMLGITFIIEFAAQLCHDAGEDGLALKAQWAGKCLLLGMVTPLLVDVGQTILSLIPQ